MSDDSLDPKQSKRSEAEEDSFTPMKRVHKINDLLDRLPAGQRSSLMHRLEGTAPQLVSPQKSAGGRQPIDTPMRRAKAIARRLTRGELPRDEEPIEEEIELKPPPAISALLDYYGKELLLIYRASPLSEWLNALKIAEPELKEHLLVHLPAREKTALEEALRQLGPVKLSEAQNASVEVMKRAAELEQKGKIQVFSPTNDSWL